MLYVSFSVGYDSAVMLYTILNIMEMVGIHKVFFEVICRKQMREFCDTKVR